MPAAIIGQWIGPAKGLYNRPMPSYFSGRGDDGTTDLLGDRRVPKSDPRPEAYGTVDEASAALGWARSLALDEDSRRVTLEVQRDLYHLMSEVAATPETAGRFRVIDGTRVAWLESQLDRIGERVVLPKEFVVGGDSQSGAAYDLARTVVRRAERRVAELYLDGELENRELIRYLNRLSSLCFVLSLWASVQAGVDRPSLAATGDR
jgi:cob(I)alamin adenosyltransferase